MKSEFLLHRFAKGVGGGMVIFISQQTPGTFTPRQVMVVDGL